MTASPASPLPQPEASWLEVNQRYLDLQMQRLRLMLQRRVLWLRRQWHQVSGADPLRGFQPLVISDAEADRLSVGNARDQEVQFYAEDARARTLGDELKRLEAQGRLLEQTDQTPALKILADLFGLHAFEKDVLLLCLAPELDASFSRLYAYVQDDVARTFATPQLAWDMFGARGDKAVQRQALLSHAPLRWFRLIEAPDEDVSFGLASLPLRLSSRVRDFLLGVTDMTAEMAALLHPLPHLPLPPAQVELAQRLAGYLQKNDSEWPLVNLVGEFDSGQEAVAATICRAFGLEPVRLNLAAWAESSDRARLERLLAREAIMLRLAFFLEPEAAHAPTLRSFLRQSPTLIFLSSRQRWQHESDREMLTLPVSRPTAKEQKSLWAEFLAERLPNLNGHLDGIVQQFDFGPSGIHQVIELASRTTQLDQPQQNSLDSDHLWQACREVARRAMDNLAQRIVPAYQWQDIVLPDDTLAQLRELASQAAYRHTVYETWGFGPFLTRGRGISALFAGPSGVGKTMAAEILANHLQLDLYRVDLAGVVSKYIGETEKNLRRIFDAAERSGAILFFDEADALFGKRTEVKDSHDRYANIEVNYLLQRMETFRGLAILATNRKSALDQAFLRRLRFVVNFPFPQVEDRLRIWQRIFPPQTPLANLDYETLARLEISGGNIRNIAVNAAFLSAAEDSVVSMKQTMRAAQREYQKINKLFSPAEFERYLN